MRPSPKSPAPKRKVPGRDSGDAAGEGGSHGSGCGEGWDEGSDDDSGDGGGRSWPFGAPGPGGRSSFAATINLLVPAGTAFGWSSMPGEAGRDTIDGRTLREMMQAAS